MSTSELHKSGQGNIEPDPNNCVESDNAKRYRSFCFTSFKVDPPIFDNGMTYLCFSPEICPTTNRKHWQGYIHWKNAKTIKASSKCLGGITVLVAGGSPAQNRIYCGAQTYTKDNKTKEANPDFKEFGKLPEQGKRVDLDDIKDSIMNNEQKLNDIIIEQPMIFHQYGRTLERIDDLRMRKLFRTEMTTCLWIWGKTGVGKSHYAFQNYHPDTHYLWKNDNGWWDKYAQQDTVILNDFRGEIPYNELLQLIDKWPYDVKRRGREPMPFTSKHIIITSSLQPHEIYKHRMEEDSLEQLYRRITLKELY